VNDPSLHDSSASRLPGERNTDRYNDLPASEADPELGGLPDDSIVSVNQHPASKGNRSAKAVVLILGSALLLGLGLWFFQNWAGHMKDTIKDAGRSGKGTSQPGQLRALLNPEGGAAKTADKPVKLGAAGEPIPTTLAVSPGSGASGATTGAGAGQGIRPLRGPDGAIVINSAGRALGVDPHGQLVEVPPIEPIAADRAGLGRVALADEGRTGKTGGIASSASKKLPSRYGGALLADGSGGAAHAAPDLDQTAEAGGTRASGQAKPPSATTVELLKALVAPKQPPEAPPARLNAGMAADTEPQGRNAGPVASQLASSTTPVARAREMADQSLLLPKGRQVDCVLTTRIINELPGFTSCALTQNLYSANGKVLLLERGTEVSGEYAVSNQMGLRRLFIVWTRVRTPDGIEVDLHSPGADALGTSGVPGYLEQRWFERIGAALLLSVMRDVVEIEVARQQSGGSDSTIVVGQPPGQNTIQAGQDISEQVVKQTLNVKPTLYINEGVRVSIYVARDLDFTPVYTLRTAAAAPAVRTAP